MSQSVARFALISALCVFAAYSAELRVPCPFGCAELMENNPICDCDTVCDGDECLVYVCDATIEVQGLPRGKCVAPTGKQARQRIADMSQCTMTCVLSQTAAEYDGSLSEPVYFQGFPAQAQLPPQHDTGASYAAVGLTVALIALFLAVTLRRSKTLRAKGATHACVEPAASCVQLQLVDDTPCGVACNKQTAKRNMIPVVAPV